MYVFAFAGHWTDGKGSFVPLAPSQNSEAKLLCPTNVRVTNITFMKDGQPFLRRPVGKVH